MNIVKLLVYYVCMHDMYPLNMGRLLHVYVIVFKAFTECRVQTDQSR